MINEDTVKRFLEQLKAKIRIYGVLFRDDRGKNQLTLSKLEIAPQYRVSVIENLTVEDYSEGPLQDTLNSLGDLWVFGKEIKKEEIYIKVTVSMQGDTPVCISFHIAEHKMNYPFKKR